ncbi:hypothetical protein BDN72DRAFT_882069 [Pluteus cervinus]|uniref:Uncharacterized protein n=1 Tax=Pluteus cervinus TaxID=181527 RepID=A0ACD3ACV1_9AGAR|nr:hypothetical protein BDN72DRAFT_882069 [Pluteus cervinus]
MRVKSNYLDIRPRSPAVIDHLNVDTNTYQESKIGLGIPRQDLRGHRITWPSRHPHETSQPPVYAVPVPRPNSYNGRLDPGSFVHWDDAVTSEPVAQFAEHAVVEAASIKLLPTPKQTKFSPSASFALYESLELPPVYFPAGREPFTTFEMQDSGSEVDARDDPSGTINHTDEENEATSDEESDHSTDEETGDGSNGGGGDDDDNGDDTVHVDIFGRGGSSFIPVYGPQTLHP